jgi:hypothetical protein
VRSVTAGAVACLVLLGPVTAASADTTTAAAPRIDLYPLAFPVDGPHSFTDDFGAPRSEGRLHQGNDIFADKMTPVVAAADGTILRVSYGERAGRYVVLKHEDGWLSYYVHLNNDTPGTDDGLYDEWPAGIAKGAAVQAGDLLGYVGDSGNAEDTPAHLHFELHTPLGEPVNPYPHLLAATGASDAIVEDALQTAYGALPVTRGTTAIGQLDPGGGFAAGVWAHGDYVYLGTWGRPQQCPASGVRIIDVSDLAAPALIGAIATGDEFAETDTDSVWVGSVDTQSFRGDLAVVAVSLCDNREPARLQDGARGLAIYDVTDPAEPTLLSVHHSGDHTQGFHELDVAVTDSGQVLVATTAMQSLLHTDGLLGDVRLIDITDPASPVELANWDFRRDVAPDPELTLSRDELQQQHAHSVAFAAGGTRLWVAHWDAGSILLDVSDPGAPKLVKWVDVAASAEGDVHSVISNPEEGLVVVSSEDLYPLEGEGHAAGWGHQLILDLAGNLLSEFNVAAFEPATDDETVIALDGYHTAHVAQLVDSRAYSAWYSSGVRIVDLADPSEPVEIGSFIPPPVPDPQGYWLAPDGTARMAMVWDVHVVDDVMYVSDMNTGLWIVRHTGDDVAEYDIY